MSIIDGIKKIEYSFIHSVRDHGLREIFNSAASSSLSPAFSDGKRRIWVECGIASLNCGVSHPLDEKSGELFNF